MGADDTSYLNNFKERPDTDKEKQHIFISHKKKKKNAIHETEGWRIPT